MSSRTLKKSATDSGGAAPAPASGAPKGGGILGWQRKSDSYPRGQALADEIRRRQRGDKRVLVSFSMGKDAIATTLALKDYGLDPYPFFCDPLPCRSWVEEHLEFYSRELFGGREIVYMVHYSFWDQLAAGTYQPPGRMSSMAVTSFPRGTFQVAQKRAIEHFGLPPNTWTAVGLRASDSVQRRVALQTRGPFNENKLTVAAIWDWSPTQVLQRAIDAGVPLPADYKLYNKSFDGLMAEFLLPLKYKRPDDYKALLEFFPLAEAEVFRYEMLHGPGSAKAAGLA